MNLDQLIATYPLPFTLLDYQKEDITTLLGLDHALVDLPVGAGKTVVATYVALGHECDRILITLPPILIAQWVRWIHSIPGAGKALGYAGSIKERGDMVLSDHRWVIASFAILKNDYKRLSEWVSSGNRGAVVVDECHNLKNSSSKLFRNVRELSLSHKTWLMTGTPMSSPKDAYAYIKIKTPNVYRNQGQFERIHVEERDFFKQPTKWANLELMQQNLRLNSVYRDKSDIHKHLQSRTWPVYYQLSKPHMALYCRLMEEQLLLLDDGSKIDASTAQKLYNAAQQIIVGFDYFSGDEDARSATYDVIDEVIDEVGVQNHSASKLLIWSWFKRTTESLTAYLQNYNAVAAYSGADSKKSVDRFLEDPNCRILVAQPGSAGQGLNAQFVSSEAIFIETPTRTISFTQAAGRISRQGQKYCANNRIAIAEGTIQETLYRNLLVNDDLVTLASGNKSSIRAAIFGK